MMLQEDVVLQEIPDSLLLRLWCLSCHDANKIRFEFQIEPLPALQKRK